MPKVVMPPFDRSVESTFVVVFAIITFWEGWIGKNNAAIVFASPSLLTFVVTLARPVLLNTQHRAWMKFGTLRYTILYLVVLGAMYCVVIAPFGVAMRLCGRHALKRLLDRTAKSYWVRLDSPGPHPDSLPRQFGDYMQFLKEFFQFLKAETSIAYR